MVKEGIWVLNPGSSNVKCTWFEFLDSDKPSLHQEKAITQVHEILQWLRDTKSAEVFVVRLVHGGPDFSVIYLTGPAVMACLKSLSKNTA